MRDAQRAAALEAPLGQGILEQFLAPSFRSHYDMTRLEKCLERQAVLDQGVAGARETGEAVSEKRLLSPASNASSRCRGLTTIQRKFTLGASCASLATTRGRSTVSPTSEVATA